MVLKDLVQNEILKVIFCSTPEMLADIFTKALPTITFVKLCRKLNKIDSTEFRARVAVEIDEKVSFHSIVLYSSGKCRKFAE